MPTPAYFPIVKQARSGANKVLNYWLAVLLGLLIIWQQSPALADNTQGTTTHENLAALLSNDSFRSQLSPQQQPLQAKPISQGTEVPFETELEDDIEGEDRALGHTDKGAADRIAPVVIDQHEALTRPGDDTPAERHDQRSC